MREAPQILSCAPLCCRTNKSLNLQFFYAPTGTFICFCQCLNAFLYPAAQLCMALNTVLLLKCSSAVFCRHKTANISQNSSVSTFLHYRSVLDETFPVLQSVCIVCKVPHLPLHHAVSPLRPLRPVSFRPAFTLSCWSLRSIHRYISQSNLHPPFPCGTKLIEDDWFFPGCSDSALETRQQELEEELAQARGLGQHRAKKLAAPSQRSLQVGGPQYRHGHVFYL